jgi:hypothetical protein
MERFIFMFPRVPGRPVVFEATNEKKPHWVHSFILVFD